ncbi:DegT/DnrJ/EryC1/StrS family aminotransferase [Fulvivirga lutea]|uniref:GDP-perosamine synthase n=1 Tax=Fulvivirga lutea TaxID=2810512 RepID=A0A975A0T2_9BACT|nr:aminotransferase class I/II-fold pyridoxal phosphate-dependent enzyme [Fulvivirga lutea]QSE96792.1 DegT/DnrJ/EryC1/StrS family aminotransferase [Fulvivirga lutea]
MNERIYLSSPHLGKEEIVFIKKAFSENWVAPLGPNVDGFEGDICKYTGIKNCAALTSGTSAIHLALIMLGVEEGDEVLASSFTFSATINPIVYQKANPVLIESESDTWNMSPEFLEEAINDRLNKGKKLKAIIPVHLYGMPSKIEEIKAIANEYEIPVIEDAAEALGSEYKGKKLGTFGDIGVFSFNGNKIITTSGGGALVSNNDQYVSKARFLATQARDSAAHYEHSQIGYNYRMSNVSAGIGRGQMLVLPEWIIKRRSIFESYKNELSDIDGISFLDEPNPDFFSNRWLTTILVDPAKTKGLSREDLRLACEIENIETRPLWKPMHLQPIFKDCPYYGNSLSERLFDQGLCLPSGSNMTGEQLDRVLCLIKKKLGK